LQGRVAVIGTFYQRHDNTEPIMRRLYRESTRKPDEAWIMCEDLDDFEVAKQAKRKFRAGKTCRIVHHPTEKNGKRYAVIPYSNKINWALDQTDADYIVYLDNASMPHPQKIELMAAALDENPTWAGVYCAQIRQEGQKPFPADKIVHDGYCAVNYTQVMHRRGPQRWPTDVRYATPDLADAMFWRQINEERGPFHPVAPDLVLDEHHITGHDAV
jgi:cellulose synthase/poly-beta-1,6-N-acetylglucosamine synthase-like glycosyltransferase